MTALFDSSEQPSQNTEQMKAYTTGIIFCLILALFQASDAMPAETEAQPAAGEAQPAAGEAQPAATDAQPAETEAQPAATEAQPAAEDGTNDVEPPLEYYYWKDIWTRELFEFLANQTRRLREQVI